MFYRFFHYFLFLLDAVFVYFYIEDFVGVFKLFYSFKNSYLQICWLQLDLCAQINGLNNLFNEILFFAFSFCVGFTEANDFVFFDDIIFVYGVVKVLFKNRLDKLPFVFCFLPHFILGLEHFALFENVYMSHFKNPLNVGVWTTT